MLSNALEINDIYFDNFCTSVKLINLLKPSGFFTYHQV